MSNRAQSRTRSEPDAERPLTKAEKRALARAAAAKAAAAERRNRIISYTLGGLAVVAVVAALVVTVWTNDDEDPADQTATPGATSGATTGATSAATPPAAGGPTSPGPFPPVPPGSDPALRTKPAVGPGSGALTKLNVTTLIQGTGPAAQSGQAILVNYVGVLYGTGQQFDASWDKSQPFEFRLGADEVIKGWDQGLVGVKVGSRVQLDLPPDLAYGENPGGGRPGGALRFVVDVLAVQ